MNSRTHALPTQILCTGPEPYTGRDGDERPEWHVFAAGADREPAGRVYTVRRSLGFAHWLGLWMSHDRKLPLAMEAGPA